MVEPRAHPYELLYAANQKKSVELEPVYTLKFLYSHWNIFKLGCPLYHDNGYLSMANNVKNQVLEPCYCHAETLLLPRWNLATATLEHCYCHAGTLLLTLLLPRWNLATATLQKKQIYIYIYIYFQFFKF